MTDRREIIEPTEAEHELVAARIWRAAQRKR
jgi:hypothetical protein